ncbi:MAG TPA: response regulator transcription factor, partial [Parafilimonas sp.]|nr:response regulator transcription factor [Parafilimonas sp.]
ADQKIRVIIFEDNKHLRESLHLLISSSVQFECIAAFADTRNILPNITKLMPEIVIMDIEMPGMNGIDATHLVKQKFPELPILILTVFNDSERIFQSLKAGGNGYLLKNSSPDEILNAMMEVYHGGTALSPAVARKLVQFFQSGAVEAQNDYHLTPKEKELLHFLVDGKSYKMIADAMQVSLETVKSHVKNVYRKLHVSSNSEAVAKAIKQRIVE